MLFQDAFARGQTPVERGRIDPTLLFAPDRPNDRVRFNYVRPDRTTPTKLVMFVHSGMIDGQPCFNIGDAVADAFRGRAWRRPHWRPLLKNSQTA